VARQPKLPLASQIAMAQNTFIDDGKLKTVMHSSIPSAPCLSHTSNNIKVHQSCNFLLAHRYFSSVAASNAVEEDSSSYALSRVVPHIRNVAIVAHVDHGKTTIVDELLKYTTNQTGQVNQEDGKDLVMDCGDLEKERGITITSKVTRMDYLHSDGERKTINVVDTPGHADFAGEVDRILAMIDGVCLIVDAAEGAMAQTKYVLSRALKLNLKPVVVLNKCDKDDAWTRIENGDVETELFDTFDALGANDEQMDYVTIYASGKSGWATDDIDIAQDLSQGGSISDCERDVSMKVLFNTILDHIPPPKVMSLTEKQDEVEEKFAMAATNVGYDNFLGRMCTGRIVSGTIQMDDTVVVLPRETITSNGNSGQLASSSISGIFVNRGVERTSLEPAVASAGDIVTISGVPDTISVGDTLTLKNNPIEEAIETPPINPPTLMMEIGANTSPLAGKEGTIVASSRVKARLISETDNNVTLSVSKSETDAERSVINARGELQLGILIEQMRREGYELTVSPPQIITTLCEETQTKLEPYEEVTIDVDTEFSGAVVNAFTGSRKGVLLNMSDSSDGKTRLEFEIPTRGLLGFNGEISTLTRGSAVVNHRFIENREFVGHIGGNVKGKLVSNYAGKASLYALASISKRGELFVAPGEEVYSGMVIGENAKVGDLEVNAVRSKATTNVRSVNKDEKLYLAPPKKMSVEELIGYMNDDEVIEITPKSVRLRKTILDSGARERNAKKRKQQLMAAMS